MFYLHSLGGFVYWAVSLHQATPDKIYKDSGWHGWRHWLGTGTASTAATTATTTTTTTSAAVATLDNPLTPTPGKPSRFLPFSVALMYVHGQFLENQDEWEAWARSGLRPANIPPDPGHVYTRAGWQGFGHWLGTGGSAGSSDGGENATRDKEGSGKAMRRPRADDGTADATDTRVANGVGVGAKLGKVAAPQSLSHTLDYRHSSGNDSEQYVNKYNKDASGGIYNSSIYNSSSNRIDANSSVGTEGRPSQPPKHDGVRSDKGDTARRYLNGVIRLHPDALHRNPEGTDDGTSDSGVQSSFCESSSSSGSDNATSKDDGSTQSSRQDNLTATAPAVDALASVATGVASASFSVIKFEPSPARTPASAIPVRGRPRKQKTPVAASYSKIPKTASYSKIPKTASHPKIPKTASAPRIQHPSPCSKWR